jgi:arabinofuranan 3-O-arabinosyltransferase
MAVDGDPGTAWVVGDRANPIGSYLTASATEGSLTLLQPQGSPTRAITSVRVDTAAGASLDVPLNASSRTTPGQRVELPDHSAIRITITGIEFLPDGTDTGPSAVGFAELGLGTHAEVVSLPQYEVAPTTPLAVVLTRLRTDPLNRWRSDPEPRLVREFTTADARTFDGAVTLRLSPRASDKVLDTLTEVTGPIANRRLTGDPSSRGIFAADGDPATAWTSPFADAVGSELAFTVGGGGLDRFVIQQPTDLQHSLITKVHLEDGDVHALVTVPAPDAEGNSTVVLPAPLPAGQAFLTVTGIEPRTTVDRRFAETTTLPVAIRELTAENIGRTDSAGDIAPFCDTSLLTLDGAPLGVSMDEQALDGLRTGRATTVATCTDQPLTVPAGTHRLEAVAGLTSGIDVDRVTLTTPGTTTGTTVGVTVTRDRTSRTATVAPCPSGCWLIMGEGQNPGWTSSVGGTAPVASTPVAGGMNGWWIPPSTTPTTVQIEWNAQTPVTAALFASLAAVGLCLFLALRRRPARRDELDFAPAPPRFGRAVFAEAPWRVSIASAVVLVAVSWLIGSPGTALVAVVVALVVLLMRRPRLTGVVALVLMAYLSARVLLRQHRYGFIADAAWPGWFDNLHHAGMLVVALLLASAVATFGDERCSDIT